MMALRIQSACGSGFSGGGMGGGLPGWVALLGGIMKYFLLLTYTDLGLQFVKVNLT